MIVEYIRYRIAPDHDASFVSAYARASASLEAAPECLGFELARCSEDPFVYVLRIEWTSAEGHLEGFRKGRHFGPFLAEIRPFIPQIEEMRHYEPTQVRWTRGAAP